MFQLDVLSHRMLVTLGTTGPSKALENKMHDANIACRKLAAEHPIIMLRLVINYFNKIKSYLYL